MSFPTPSADALKAIGEGLKTYFADNPVSGCPCFSPHPGSALASRRLGLPPQSRNSRLLSPTQDKLAEAKKLAADASDTSAPVRPASTPPARLPAAPLRHG